MTTSSTSKYLELLHLLSQPHPIIPLWGLQSSRPWQTRNFPRPCTKPSPRMPRWPVRPALGLTNHHGTLTVVACCRSSFPFRLKSVQYIINYLHDIYIYISKFPAVFALFPSTSAYSSAFFQPKNSAQNPKHPPKSSKVQTALGGWPGSRPRRGLRVGLGPPAGRMEPGPADAGAHPPGECPAESGGIGELWDL